MQQDQAAEARAREDARQARVEQGQSLLDAMFEGGTTLMPESYAEAVQINPDADYGDAQFEVRYDGAADPTGETRTFEGYQPYLDDRRRTMLDYYKPELQQQYGDASDQLKYGLARAGQTLSTEGAESRGDLTNQFDSRQTEMLSRVDGDIANTRSRFEKTRSNLEDMLLSSGDAARVANRSLTSLDTLRQEQPQIDPLGDVFANALSAYSSYGRGQTQGRVAGIYDQPSITSRVSGSGTLID
jgi:hypothetical protein